MWQLGYSSALAEGWHEDSVLEKEGALHGQNQRCPLSARPRGLHSQDIWEINRIAH